MGAYSASYTDASSSGVSGNNNGNSAQIQHGKSGHNAPFPFSDFFGASKASSVAAIGGEKILLVGIVAVCGLAVAWRLSNG